MKTDEIDHYVKKLEPDTQVTVKVHATREFKARVLIGTWLINLAARVMGCKIDIVHDE